MAPSTRRKSKRDHSSTTSSSTSPSKRRSKKTKASKLEEDQPNGSSSHRTSARKKTRGSLSSSSSSGVVLVTLLRQLDALAQSKHKSVAAIQSISKATILQSTIDFLHSTTNPTPSSNATGTTTAAATANTTGIGVSMGMSAGDASMTNTTTTTTNSSYMKKSSQGNHLPMTESQRNANLIILATHILNRTMIDLNTLHSETNHNRKDGDDININSSSSSNISSNSNINNDNDNDNTSSNSNVNVEEDKRSRRKKKKTQDTTTTTTTLEKEDEKKKKKKKKKKEQDDDHDDHDDDTTIPITTPNKNITTPNENQTNEKKKQLAMILSIYSSLLTKILLHDKTQLERTINATSSSSRSSAGSTSTNNTLSSTSAMLASNIGSGSGLASLSSTDRKKQKILRHAEEEGLHPKSILGRAILSSMLSSLKSMHTLSSMNLVSTDKIYAKLMWRNAIVIETLLALGANYRSLRAGGGASASASASASGGTHGSKSTSGKMIHIQSSLLSSAIGNHESLHGLSGVGGGIGGIGGTSLTSVHAVPMDLRRINAWNEICHAMESEIDGDGGTSPRFSSSTKSRSSTSASSGSGSGSGSGVTTPLLTDDLLVEALTMGNEYLFPSLSSSKDNNNTKSEGESILQLLSFHDEKINESGDDTTTDSQSKPPSSKRRRTETTTPSSSSSSPTATRTRSRVLSDKIDKVSNEYTILSAHVSDAIFAYPFHNVVIGGNRFTMKKWSSSAFAWICNGQEIALQALRNLFLAVSMSTSTVADMDSNLNSNMNHYNANNTTDWHEIMQVSAVITETPPTKSRKKGKAALSDRKRATMASAKNKGSVVNIPGNLALLTYASRVIDIVNEGGKMAGNSPQRNNAENYVNLFHDNSSSSSSSNSSNNSSTETVTVMVAKSKASKSSKPTSKPRRQSTRKSKESSSVTTSSSPDVRADVVMSSGGKSKPKGAHSKTNQRKRTDIRNVSIVLMELLLAAHHDCLRDNVAIPAAQTTSGLDDECIEMTHFTPQFPLEDGEVLGQIVLNDDSENIDGGIPVLSMDHKKNLLAVCRYFPQTHRTIETLIKCVVSSVASIEDCTTRLTGIGAALAMKFGTVINKLKVKESKHQKKAHGSIMNTIIVVDARLCSWAVCHLTTSVDNIVFLSKQSCQEKNAVAQHNELPTDLVQRFSLDKHMTMTNQIGDQCTREYLGLFEENGNSEEESSASDISLGQRKLHGGILALFLRSMLPHNKGGKKDSATRSMLKLTEMLLRIITCCYSLDTKHTTNNNRRRSTFSRFTLAADCIDTLRKCLSCAPSFEKQKNTDPSSLMHSLIRQSSLVPTIVCCFVELGQVLEKNVIQQRVDVFGESNECDAVKSSSLLQDQNFLRLEFEQWERHLWSSHVKLALVLSRGHTEFESSSIRQPLTQTKCYLGTNSNKLSIFRAVMAVQPESYWPLYLPSIQHVLVTTSLISDPIPRNLKDAAAEKFICDMMLQSITNAFDNPINLVDKARQQKKNNIQVSDEEISLSLRDCRLFAIATCRLPKKDQVKQLSKLVSSLSSQLLKIKKDEELQKLLIAEKDYSGFLARTITLTSVLIDMVTAGKPLLDSLCDNIGTLHYYLPSIIEVDSESDLEGGDWYKKESCFMGLWEEWESSALPLVDVINDTFTCPLSSDEVSMYASAIEFAMEFGFDSAMEDKCLLLFAAWNASGKLCGIESKSWKMPTLVKDLKNISAPLKLFKIRDDVCNLYQEFDVSKNSTPDTFLKKQLKMKDKKQTVNVLSSTGSKGVLQLRNALSSNQDMLRELMKTCTTTSSSFLPSSGDFAVIESTLVYTSFLISMFTTNGTEFLSAIIPREKNQEERKRKGSSASADSYDDDGSEESAESESGYPELDDDDDDAKSDGISRFHEICEELGAAPIHPDWLDTQTTFRDGITKSTAAEAAGMTLRILTDFGSIIFDRYIQLFNSLLSFDASVKTPTSSPFNIINGIVNGEGSAGWYEHIGDLYSLDTNLISLIESGLPCKNLNSVKEAWTPNSAHRIRGKLQNTMSRNGWAVSSPELRAAAEWEILLSDALLGACADIDHGSFNPDMRKKFHEILCWARVLQSTVNAIITTTALLRFSLNDGKGRTRHHFNDFEPNRVNRDKWYQPSPINRFPSHGDLSMSGMSSTQLDSSICKSFCLLSDIQSSGAVSVDCQLSAQAATCHLVGNDNDLQLIFQVKKIRNFLTGLQALFNFVKGKESGDCMQSTNAILDKIIQSENIISDIKYLEALLFSLGSPLDLSISTLQKSGRNLKSLLCCDFKRDKALIAPWQWGVAQHDSIAILVQIMQGRIHIELSGVARLKIIRMMKNALKAEEKIHGGNDGAVKLLLLQHWDKAKKNQLSEMVLRDICLRDVDQSNSDEAKLAVLFEISRDLTSIIAYLSGANREEVGNSSANRFIFQILKDHAASWMMNSKLDCVLLLLFLLSVCHGAIGEVGSDFLGGLEKEHNNERRLSVLEMFYKFLCDSKKRLQGDVDNPIEENNDVKKQITQGLQSKDGKSSFITKSGDVKERCCTYVTTSGNFSEQHWYNCYTCGLLWDKGCCSICAQVCHKGHDVGYSRKSSFFCDCGAEVVGTDCDRGPCKCLSPLSDTALSLIYDTKASPKAPSDSIFQKIGNCAYNSPFWNEATKISASNFPSIFVSSLEKFTESSHPSILEKLFEVFNVHFDAWTEKHRVNSMMSDNYANKIENSNDLDYIKSERLSLISRNGKQVETSVLAEKVFSLVRVFKPTTINTKISNETSTDRLKKTIISKNCLERKIIVADRHGRIIISEAGCLLFCAGLSLANVRHRQTSSDTQLQRSDLCVLGSSKVKCSIVGMALSPDIGCRLVAWGTSDINIFLINEKLNNVESVIELEVGLDPYDCETDYVVKVEWLLGSSSNILVVFCATSVKVFDIRKSTPTSSNENSEYSCQSIASYTIAYEDVLIKAGTLIPLSDQRLSGLQDNDNELRTKIAILFDTGRLQLINLNIDYNEDIKDTGEFNIGYGDGISLPVAGIRRCGLSVEPEGATAKSLGQGDLLQYLHQSEILLYKCVSSPVVAFMLDKSGCISRSFEFLPHVLSREMLGSSVHGCSITGPFTNWTELGQVQRDGSNFYRVSFVGRSTRMNQPKLVYMEFNEYTTRVSEIKTASNSLTLALNASVEGSVAFSAPILAGSHDGMIADNRNYFDERVFLTTVSSNGSIIIYGEESDKLSGGIDQTANDVVRSDLTKRRRAFSDSVLTHNRKEVGPVSVTKDDPKKKVSLPSFPLTIFEELINMSDKSELVFGGDCVKDPVATKNRLSIMMSNDEFIFSPSKDGCTLTVSLQSPEMSKQEASIISTNGKDREPLLFGKVENKGDLVEEKNLVIVAVRILLGSKTTENLPKEISVMGRQIKLCEKMKRWYDIPLTDEEIMLGILGGAVTISIGTSPNTTTSPPLIDCVEVFAQDRSQLNHLFSIRNVNDYRFDNMGLADEDESRKSLDTSILAIAHICSLLDNKVDLSSQMNLQTLRRLIQVTALDSPKDGNVRNHVIDLVKSIEKNDQNMQMLLDEGTLQGISNTLSDLKMTKSDPALLPIQWRDRVVSKVSDCLDVTLLIAKDRAMNYKSSIEKLISTGHIQSSIALQAKEILKVFTNRTSIVKTSSKLIQLAIFESMTIIDGFPNPSFADLDLVSEILHCCDETIVKESCIKLAETMKEIQSFDKVQAYQCDGCSAFPITGTRYTLEDKNIDLCKVCFECGNQYARSRNFRSGTPVLVKERKLQMEGGKVMSCSQIRQMITKLVPANILEQVREANALREGGDLSPMNDADGDDDDDLEMALKMSLEAPVEDSNETELQRTSSYTMHMNVISKLLQDIEQSLSTDKEALIHHPIPIIDLLLTLVVQCDSSDDQLTFGKKICDVVCCNMFAVIEAYLSKPSSQGSVKRIKFALFIYLRTLEGLVTNRESIIEIINTKTDQQESQVAKKVVSVPPILERSKDKTDPRFVCETHGIPAVRRRCSHGENKDRRFYVCGMDRLNRCKYFKWADEGDAVPSMRAFATDVCNSKQSITSVGSASDELSVKVDPEIKALLWNIMNDQKQPLQQRLCSLLQMLLKDLESQGTEAIDVGEKVRHEKIAKFHVILKQNETRNSTLKEELIGMGFKRSKLGVFCQHYDSGNQAGHGLKLSQLRVDKHSLVEASLDLLSKIAMNALKSSQNPQSSWEGWFALLCEIMSSSSSSHLQSQAKKMMKRLCGGRSVVYHQIRDQYVFGFQFMKLLLHCEAPLQAALDVREKARRCGQQWRLADLTWSTLPTGGLIGVQDLISEDNYGVLKMEAMSKILDDLINTAKNRGKNWSHFCALDKIPQKNNSEIGIRDRSPICLLLWMACSLPPNNQVKVLRLMEIALSVSNEKDFILSISSTGEESTGIMSTDGGTDFESTPHGKHNNIYSEKEIPQVVLLEGASGMSIDDIHAFIFSFILNGEGAEVRALASNVCLKILSSVPRDWIDGLLKRLINILVLEIGTLGCEVVEFLRFLHSLVSNNQVMMDIDVSILFQAAAAFFTHQLQASRDAALSSGKEATLLQIESSEDCHVFDFAPCLHCHHTLHSKKQLSTGSKSSESDMNIGAKVNANVSKTEEKISKIDRDLGANKRRLDSCTLNTVSSEFSCYLQLKYRMSTTEVHLSVSDPRGRFAKTVGIFFSPRPVRSVNELKQSEYMPLWQRCGTLTLPRGGAKTSFKFSCPIVAANLKFEYEEFYEKISSSRPSGAIVIHCPRCTRVVNNAHGGVCGNCGEVAFQCRKCRHINYDRLDAFLCVECGYCSSGTFSYEITASAASRAVAIIDDEGLERAVRLMWVAGNKYNEYKTVLIKTLQNSTSLSGRKRYQNEIDASINKLNSPLKRALLGDLPKISSKKCPGNSNSGRKKRLIASENLHSANRSEPSSAANRARSLLNLAIQLRSGSGNEVPDSLSRLVATIARNRSGNNPNKRSRDEDNEDKRDTPVDGSDGEPLGKAGELSNKALQNCNKLYRQMREAERDGFEFRRRIVAWKRLNHDALANYGREALHSNCVNGISHCSHCSPIILKHLLDLIRVLFTVRGATLSDTALFRDFISLLFDEVNDTNHVDLHHLKRSMIIALATKSTLGSDMIFSELQTRLQGSKSVACADILGELIAEDVQSPEKFVQLAMQTLN